MTHFSHLRKTPWHPTFTWVETTRACADKINSYHEDYPKHVAITDMVIQNTVNVGKVFTSQLLLIHRTIFAATSFAGKLREVEVRVGPHRPPEAARVVGLMDDLEYNTDIRDLTDLIEWYKGFETIHPFEDGNGRVGGVVVAAYAHRLHPEKGWYAPNQ